MHDCLKTGKQIVIKFDESEEDYEELFDPNFVEFYGKGMLNPTVWEILSFRQGDAWKWYSKYFKEKLVPTDFRLVLVSKFVLQASERRLEAIKQRFGKSLQLNKFQFLVLQNYEIEENSRKTETVQISYESHKN